MVYNKILRHKKKIRQKAYRKYRKFRGRTSMIRPINLGTGFPNKMLIKHRYCQAIGITATTGTFSSFQFSCNGMFQPATSGNHQPYYFDQMTAIYDHYCVIGSKIKIIAAADSSGSTTKPCIIGLYVNDDTNTQFTSSTGVQERQGRTRLLAYNATRPVTLTDNWSAKKYFSKNPLANTELQGTSAANPTEQSFYTISLQDITTAVTATVDIWVEITYIAVWKELKDISQS